MRPSKNKYYLDIAAEVAKRSTCLKRQYGAVIVKNDEIIATGYNGAARGEKNCCDTYTECPRASKPHNSGDYSDCPAVHAEQNAIISAARKDMIGATLYLSGWDNGERITEATPCPICSRLIKNAGIDRVISSETDYHSEGMMRDTTINKEVIRMKTINEILENYSEYETFLEDRFGSRLCDFLTVEQAKKIGFRFMEGYVHKPKEWTEENVLAQLKQDVEFGWEKCCDQRGISANLMYEVVKAWCKVLGNGLDEISYSDYGSRMFKKVAEYYGWGSSIKEVHMEKMISVDLAYPHVIAVDFDGTLCVNKYPEIGRMNAKLIERIKKMQGAGVKFILWTCRAGTLLDEAIEACESQGLHFDAINDNLPEHKAVYPYSGRKITANEYWDDKAVSIIYKEDTNND